MSETFWICQFRVYPRLLYSNGVLSDVWETAFCHDACGSFTWHVFKTPPTRVYVTRCVLSSSKLTSRLGWI